MKKINCKKLKAIIKGWRMGDYLRQFSIVAAGVIVTFWGSDRITEYSRQKEVRATMQLVIGELKESRTALQQIRKKMDVDRYIVQIVLEKEFNAHQISADTLAKYQSFFGNLTSFRYSTDALEVLKASSLMQYIPDKKLLQDVTGTYQRLKNAQDDIASYYKMKGETINEVIFGLNEEKLNSIVGRKDVILFTNFFFSCNRWRVFCYLVPDYLDWEKFAELDARLSEQIHVLEEKYN